MLKTSARILRVDWNARIFSPKNTRIKESKVQTSARQFSLGPWVLTMKPN
jgi:hypothetical protein